MERKKTATLSNSSQPIPNTSGVLFPCYRQKSARIIVLALILLPVKIKFFRQELVEEDVSVMHC